jgi:alginate O-acetyltransferase complex protein AlgI
VCLSVTLLWVFFRLSIAESLLFIPKLFGFTRAATTSLELNLLVDARFYIFLLAGITFSFPWWRKLPTFHLAYIPRYAASLCLFILSLCSLASNAYNPFIYFRF